MSSALKSVDGVTTVKVFFHTKSATALGEVSLCKDSVRKSGKELIRKALEENGYRGTISSKVIASSPRSSARLSKSLQD